MSEGFPSPVALKYLCRCRCSAFLLVDSSLTYSKASTGVFLHNCSWSEIYHKPTHHRLTSSQAIGDFTVRV